MTSIPQEEEEEDTMITKTVQDIKVKVEMEEVTEVTEKAEQQVVVKPMEGPEASKVEVPEAKDQLQDQELMQLFTDLAVVAEGAI